MKNRKLEIGGGDYPLEGFEQLNKDWGHKKLLFDDNTFDEVYTSHCIEHVPWNLVEFALSEAIRVLSKGGIIEIHTVNFRYLVDCYLKGEAGDTWQARGANKNLDPFMWLNSRIFSVMPVDNLHMSVLDKPYLISILEKFGIKEIQEIHRGRGIANHGKINMGFKGVKF